MLHQTNLSVGEVDIPVLFSHQLQDIPSNWEIAHLTQTNGVVVIAPLSPLMSMHWSMDTLTLLKDIAATVLIEAAQSGCPAYQYIALRKE